MLYNEPWDREPVTPLVPINHEEWEQAKRDIVTPAADETALYDQYRDMLTLNGEPAPNWWELSTSQFCDALQLIQRIRKLEWAWFERQAAYKKLQRKRMLLGCAFSPFLL